MTTSRAWIEQCFDVCCGLSGRWVVRSPADERGLMPAADLCPHYPDREAAREALREVWAEAWRRERPWRA